MNMNDGEKISPGKLMKEKEKVRLIESRVSSSSTVVVTPFLVSIPLEHSFDSKSIICLCFLNDTNGKNAFSFYPHSSLPTWDPWNPFHSLWCYDYELPSVQLISKSMLRNKRTFKVCHWPTKKNYFGWA